MKKRALNSAFLQKWTKSFKTTGCVGNDVGQLLQTELDKLGVNAEVVAIINDTVGTQLAGKNLYFPLNPLRVFEIYFSPRFPKY